MADIQWFPGHMAKALRLIREKMSQVDIVFELVDARIPYSSQNPEVALAAGQKPRLLILTKADLADPNITQQWLDYFNHHNQAAIALDSRGNKIKGQVTSTVKRILHDKLAAEKDKGMKKRPIRAMCVGVPNVGKSTLLNHLVGKNVAATANRPGVTTGQQWLRSSADLELLDTPGVLWPKFANQDQAKLLAISGAIKDSLYPKDDVALYALQYLRKFRQKELMNRYRLSEQDFEESVSDADLLLTITAKMGFRDDYDRGSERLIFEIRRGKLGKISLESPQDLSDKQE
ncbi:ribosome biogenesis GTPase YlqF [Limosilactobacillus sp.]|uniref:ribosome biogenesis GTPase YlqF n=1 Tax=Limosilactobacillus sp. TaxID=2773925 RepID=UPI00345E2BDC